jgi:hypothetical protein
MITTETVLFLFCLSDILYSVRRFCYIIVLRYNMNNALIPSHLTDICHTLEMHEHETYVALLVPATLLPFFKCRRGIVSDPDEDRNLNDPSPTATHVRANISVPAEQKAIRSRFFRVPTLPLNSDDLGKKLPGKFVVSPQVTWILASLHPSCVIEEQNLSFGESVRRERDLPKQTSVEFLRCRRDYKYVYRSRCRH